MLTMARPTEPAPMIEMNTTPLIDVMLVLIIMLIITIPLQNHAVKLDLPLGEGIPISQVRNVLIVDAEGGLQWNGRRVGKSELAALLRSTTDLPKEPELHLRPNAQAPYGVVDEILVLAKRAKVQRLGFVGNEAYARF